MVKPGLGWTFDTVAEEYDKWRPNYVDKLYDDIFSYKMIDNNSNVLEVGIGTGQATEPILKTGCNLVAVEYGKSLSEITRKKFSSYKNISVVTSAFQDFQYKDNSFDLVYSASAFHWIPEEIGYSKVYDMLKPGGAFARFADHSECGKYGDEDLWNDIEAVYQKYMQGPKPSPYTEENAMRRANIALKYGFIDIAWKLYRRSITYNSNDYVKRMAIQSDKIAMEKNMREQLLNDIKNVIDNHGGIITVHDIIDLNIARKPI